ncbi:MULTISPECIES: META domain-containing protein [unclassified Gordonia (in: high G+C Gram-positive bacteria)]|uniref:META domain-containing protein n=1 Tax=unclassified Gordonia (in: high G+C Gram-positive bacteria) TaxID=2657482 RepID=UPI001F0E85DD|nr:META domain-containing protein [Gordonia sp. ABSL49_1]MCH5642677.1 META domain-containing protein [Gordonia sp. ABSL49_1]
MFAAFCLGFAALAFGAFGSGGAHAAPAPLLGKHYSSTAVTGTPIPGGGPLVIDFPSAGRIALTAGCNRHIGSVRIEGSTMRIGPLMSTRMACPGPRAGADAWLANFTKAPLNWYSVGQALVLTGPTNQVLLTEGDS